MRVLNRGIEGTWTVERLRRTVRQLASEGIIEASLLDRARPQPSDDRLIRLVAVHQGSCARPHAAANRRPTRGHARAHAARRNTMAPLLGQAPAGPGSASRFAGTGLAEIGPTVRP